MGEGNSSGIAYAAAHPSEFSLHTPADLNQSGVLFRANGVRDGNASGQSHVLNNLASFELVTESELNATRLVERELGRAAWALRDALPLRAGVADPTSRSTSDERRERRVDDALVGVLTVAMA